MVTTTTRTGFVFLNLIIDVHHSLIAPGAPKLGFINLIIVVDDPHPKRIAALTALLTNIDSMLEVCLMDHMLVQQFENL